MTEPTIKNHMTGSRTLAIITGILLVVLGILFFVFPLGTMLFADIFITIGLLIFGIYRIVSFIAAPSGYRDGWQLALGILWVICAVVILASSASNIIISFAFLLGVLAMMSGLSQIIAYASLKGASGSGFVLASGIINALLALFLLAAPFVATAALAYIQGFYLCFAGVALVIEAFSKHPATFFDNNKAA